MAGSLTQPAALLMLDAFTGRAAYPLPTLYLALTKTAPTAAAAGTELTTTDYTAYARKPMSGAGWTGASTAGRSTYQLRVNFGVSSIPSGTMVLGWEIWDAATAGNRLWWSSFANTHPLTARCRVEFAPGQLCVSIPPVALGKGWTSALVMRFVDHLTGKTAFGTPPAQYLSVGLTTSALNVSGSPPSELTYTGYARSLASDGTSGAGNKLAAAVTNGSGVGEVTVASNIDLGTNTGANQTATTFCVWDALAGGTPLYGGALTGITILTGEWPRFTVGQVLYRLA